MARAGRYRQAKHWVARFLYDPDYAPQRVFERFIYVLIILSVSLLVVEFIWFPTGVIPRPLLTVDLVILIIFAVEYAARLWVVEPEMPHSVRLTRRQRFLYTVAAKIGWALKPYNLIDLAAILPLFPFLRSLRVLRVLRLLTHTSVTRHIFHYFNPFAAASQTLRTNQTLYLFVASFIIMVTSLGAITAYLAEHPYNERFATPMDALWWATVTVTTVGYGDVYPITIGGRLVAMVLMFSGFFTFALMAGVVSQTLVHTLLQIREEGIRMTAMVNQIVVCGWNNRTLMLLREILDQSPEAARRVVVFANCASPADLPPWVTFVEGDPTEEIELSKVRMGVADIAVIVAEEREGASFSDADARSLLTIFTIRAFESKLTARGSQRTRPIHIAAELLDPDNLPFFKAAGANEIIQTALIGTTLLARAAAAPETGQMFGELVSVEGHSLHRMLIPATVQLPCTFWELAAQLKKDSNALVIGYERDGHRVINPSAEFCLVPGDFMLYLAAEAEVVSRRQAALLDQSFWGPLDQDLR